MSVYEGINEAAQTCWAARQPRGVAAYGARAASGAHLLDRCAGGPASRMRKRSDVIE